MSFVATCASFGGFSILNVDNRVNTHSETVWCETYVVYFKKYSNFDSKDLIQHTCISYEAGVVRKGE
jgi:hypothetical protein